MNDSKTQERLAAAVDAVSRNTEAQNDSPPQTYFFDALNRQRYAIDHCGANWEQPLPARHRRPVDGRP
jgi:hypothetical protein